MKHLQALMARSIAMEKDVQDGKTFVEKERVIYARISDFEQLASKAKSADHQEQWGLKIPKTDKNFAEGQVRVRAITPLAIRDGQRLPVPTEGAQYVYTVKAKQGMGHNLEAPIPATADAFEIFKRIAENGMIKDRYHFPVEGTPLVYEIDVFLKPDGSYHEWVKIDLETKDMDAELPPLPIEVEEQILDNTEDKAEQAKIKQLYNTIFLTPNVYVNGEEGRDTASLPKEDDDEGDHEYR